MEYELVLDAVAVAQLISATEATKALTGRDGRGRQRIRMEFVFDGERSAGIELVERLLTTGALRRKADAEIASTAIEALEYLELPWLMDEMVESGEMLAQQIHSKASHGLQEAVQNAQDQGETMIRFGLGNWQQPAPAGEMDVRSKIGTEPCKESARSSGRNGDEYIRRRHAERDRRCGQQGKEVER